MTFTVSPLNYRMSASGQTLESSSSQFFDLNSSFNQQHVFLDKDSFIPNLFDVLKPSVVQISPSSLSVNSSLLGSGFVYDKEGHIITNNHVVGNATAVIVSLSNGDQYDAKIIGKDPINDIAVLKLFNYTTIVIPEHLVPIKFGDSSANNVGERVIAIGNPYGFSNTLSVGFISQIDKWL
jgi:S1-C subfamily serine protease